MGFVLVLTFNCSSVPACHHRLLRLAKVPNNCVQMGHASENIFSMFNSNSSLTSVQFHRLLRLAKAPHNRVQLAMLYCKNGCYRKYFWFFIPISVNSIVNQGAHGPQCAYIHTKIHKLPKMQLEFTILFVVLVKEENSNQSLPLY